MVENKFIHSVFADANLSVVDMEQVIKAFVQVEFKKNDFIFTANQTLNEYYFLEKGFIRSFMYDYEGTEVTTKFYSMPEIVIDWTSFMLRKPTRENFQASTDCICWCIKIWDFQKLFNSMKGFNEAGRKRFASSYFELKKNRLAMISYNAKERYQHLVEEHPEIIHNASLKHIATYLGVTDTSLSRIRKEIMG